MSRSAREISELLYGPHLRARKPRPKLSEFEAGLADIRSEPIRQFVEQAVVKLRERLDDDGNPLPWVSSLPDHPPRVSSDPQEGGMPMTEEERHDAAIREITRWGVFGRPHVMRRKERPSFYKVRQAVLEGAALLWPMPNASLDDAWDKFEEFVQQPFQSFVIQHDWGGLLEVGEIGEKLPAFQPPFPFTCYELRISGKDVCACLTPEGLLIWIETSVGWYPAQRRVFLDDPSKGGLIDELNELIEKQAVAISVMLEAGVATSTLVRAPDKLNRARERRGRTAMPDYHVVDLSRRSRVDRLPVVDGQEPRQSPRLHFRRGHWVQFEHHKTWRRWSLVGDPDLGFIDKHYKL